MTCSPKKQKKIDKLSSFNYSRSDIDYDELDDIVELTLDSAYQDPAQKEVEENVTMYLHSLGLKMKTDPTTKEQNYYMQIRKKIHHNDPIVYLPLPEQNVFKTRTIQAFKRNIVLF